MTCGEHAKIMKALSPHMGPAVQALYDRFMKDEHEECIAAESQVVFLYSNALRADAAAEAAAEA